MDQQANSANFELRESSQTIGVVFPSEISEAQSGPDINNLEVPVPADSPPITEAPSTPSDVLEELYEYITKSLLDPESKERAVWVSSAYPSQISLKLRDIQKIVNPLGCMRTESLNLAIRKMVREESNNGNLTNSNLLGCKNYVSADFARYAISEVDGHTKMEASILHECVDQHTEVLCIPVIHDGHWTLYAFNMEDEMLSILDPLPNPMRHKDIWLKICRALETAKAKSNLFKNKFCDFSNWKHEFVKVPQQGNSYDSGFLVFNFMRQWDGCQLDPSIRLPTDSRMMRKEFLAYILSFKDNEAHELPCCASDLIKCLPSGPGWTRHIMGSRLLNVLREGNSDKFKGLEPNQRTPENVIDLDSMILGGITYYGDGVLHIAASFGYLQLIKDILFKLGMLPHQCNAGIAVQSNNRASAIMAEETSSPNAVESNRASTIRSEKGSSPSAAESNNNRANAIIAEEGRNLSASESNNRASAVIAEEGHSPNALENDAAEACIGIEPVDPVQVATFLTIRNRSGETCLHEAVRSGHKELVELLISVDGNVRKENVSNTALKKIAALTQVVDYKGISPLYLAVRLRRNKIVKVLLSDNISSPSYAGPGGRTALHAAVLLDTELCNQLMLWKPELLGKVDKSGNTPLHLMASVVGSHFVERLPPPDANRSSASLAPLGKDSNGWFPIHVAAANGNLSFIKQLLKAYPGLMWSLSASGQSFLHVAVDKKSIYVVDYVCREYALFQILNLRDHDGNTALHLAVKSGNQIFFCTLMNNRRVCLSMPNNEGHTPLDLAALNLPPGLKIFLNSRVLIYRHLKMARADIGTYRREELTDNLPEVDDEKLSETISKYAGLIAVCAIFMLNISVTAFFSVAREYLPTTDPVAPASLIMSHSERKRAHALKALIISDAIAFASSALAAFCCTFAGLSSMDNAICYAYLQLGVFSLGIASFAMVLVFALAAYSAYALVDFHIAIIAASIAFVAIVPIAVPLFDMLMLHLLPLSRRFLLSKIILQFEEYMVENHPYVHTHFVVNLEKTFGFISYRQLRYWSTFDDRSSRP